MTSGVVSRQNDARSFPGINGNSRRHFSGKRLPRSFSTSSAWPSTLTLSQRFATLPSPSIKYVVRTMPMPFVSPATVAALLACPVDPARVLMPRYDGKRGHPLALPRALGSEILMASARSNLSGLLTTLGTEREYLDVTDPGILRDIDVKSDLE